MADTIKTNLGPVTAYADAKAHGYTGTREEFGQLLAGAAGNLQDAVAAKEGAEAAKQSAETAQKAAAENQKNAGTQAANAKASADTAAEQANAAKESATGAANSASAAQESETNAGLSADAAANSEAAAKQAQQAAETAKTDAEAAQTAAGTSADAAANSAADAKRTLESIPADYSTLSGKVDENTSGISELKEDLEAITQSEKISGSTEYFENQYINYSSGSSVPVAESMKLMSTGWVNVEENTIIVLVNHYTLPGTSNPGMAFFDKKYKYISGIPFKENEPAYCKVPENAKFLRYTLSAECKETHSLLALKLPEYFVKSSEYKKGQLNYIETIPSLTDNISVYPNGVMSLQFVKVAHNSGFPSSAGVLLTLANVDNFCGQFYLSETDYTGLWYRTYNADGTPKSFLKTVNDIYYRYNLPKNLINKSVYAKRQPIVTFIDDDGTTAAYNRYKPLAQTYGVPFCCAVITSLIGKTDSNGDEHMTADQLRELQNDYNFEILSHTHIHTLMNEKHNYSEKSQAASLSFDTLIKNGLKVRGLCYPEGVSDYNGREVTSKFYDYAFKGSASNQEIRINTGCVPSYYINRCNMGAFADPTTSDYPDTRSLNYYKGLVDEAIASTGWLVFTLHAWREDFDDTQYEYLKKIIEYCKEKSVSIVTSSTGFDMFGNQIQVGDYLGYWNYNGYAMNKLGDESLKRFHQPDVTGETPITFFPLESVTQHCVQSAYSATFPTYAGIVETHRFRADMNEYGYQIWFPALDDNYIYRRRCKADGTWNAWRKIQTSAT